MGFSHSAGCLVAVDTYFESPERVAALILVAPALFSPLFIKKEAKYGALRERNKGKEGESALDDVDNSFSRIWKGLCKLLGAIAGCKLKMVKEMSNMVGSLYVKAVTAVLRSLGIILVSKCYEAYYIVHFVLLKILRRALLILVASLSFFAREKGGTAQG